MRGRMPNISVSVARRLSKTAGARSEAGLEARPEVVGPPAPAEREPVVGGPLAVDDHVALVAEGLTAAQADPLPLLGGQRLGGDHQGVDRGEVAAVAGEAGRV